MPGKSEKLSFFCEKCGQPIERNICPTHGIDFVTIKKISLKTQVRDHPRNGTENLSTAGGLAKIESQATHSSSGEMGIARLDDLPDDDSVSGTALQPLDAELPVDNGQEAEDVYEYFGAPENSVADNTFTRGNPYRDTESDVEDYYDPENNNQNISSHPGPVSQSNGLLWGILAALLIAVGGLSYFFFANSGPSPTALYSEAEVAMENHQFKDARNMYASFLQDFPDDPLMPVVREKLAIVERKILNERANTPEGQRRIQQLMLKANIAFNNENYITPVEDNVAQYLKKILRISPNYQPALDMQQKIFEHFKAKAEQEEADGNLNEALGFYQVMSSLKPNNMDVLAKIQTLLSSGKN